MSQSKKNSVIESLVNTFIGMIITFLLSPIIYWVADVEISLPKMGICTVLFTIISVLRNYGIRRYFEWRERRTIEVSSKWMPFPISYGNTDLEEMFQHYNMVGQTILKTTGEGCQNMHQFEWLGIVRGFRKNDTLKCSDIVIEILIHNHSYSDARDSKEKEIYTYPLVNGDIQNVNGAWVLFAN